MTWYAAVLDIISVTPLSVVTSAPCRTPEWHEVVIAARNFLWRKMHLVFQLITPGRAFCTVLGRGVGKEESWGWCHHLDSALDYACHYIWLTQTHPQAKWFSRPWGYKCDPNTALSLCFTTPPSDTWINSHEKGNLHLCRTLCKNRQVEKACILHSKVPKSSCPHPSSHSTLLVTCS